MRMSMKTKFFFGFPIVAFILLAFVVPVQAQSRLSQAEQEKHEAQLVWDGMILAKGGREKLRSIRNMLLTRSTRGNRTLSSLSLRASKQILGVEVRVESRRPGDDIL